MMSPDEPEPDRPNPPQMEPEREADRPGGKTALGQIRSTITREIVRLQAEYYGQGPTRATDLHRPRPRGRRP